MSKNDGAYFWTHLCIFVLPCPILQSLRIQCAREKKNNLTLEFVESCMHAWQLIGARNLDIPLY